MDASISRASTVARTASLDEVAVHEAGRIRSQEQAKQAPASEAQERPREATRAPSKEQLQEIVREFNLRLPEDRGIRFQVSGDGEELTVQVVDQSSDEVVRSIPTERLSGLRKHLNDLTGALLDDFA